MNKKILFTLLGISLFSLIMVMPGWAQTAEPGLQIRLSRTMGFSSGTGQIQGAFKIKASGPSDLSKVAFFIDDTLMGEVDQAPFELSFNTDSYSLGIHTFSATGSTTSGQQLASNTTQAEFVSPNEGFQSVLGIIGPIVIFILVAIVIATLVPMLFTRGKTTKLPLGSPRNYAPLGGTICPKCGRPFGIHIYGINIVVGKLDRCPYCGKWSIVHRVSPQMLHEAEQAELSSNLPVQDQERQSEEDDLRKDIEDSRYRDL
jgi:DNA-directed RNA polymerase subunit RPC12/RpoP